MDKRVSMTKYFWDPKYGKENSLRTNIMQINEFIYFQEASILDLINKWMQNFLGKATRLLYLLSCATQCY